MCQRTISDSSTRTATPLLGALLSTDYELWDGAHRRLTVLLDPARIKRGLAAHRQAGYPIRIGRPFRLVVDPGFRDARGAPLRSGAEKRYGVVADERRRVEPATGSAQPRRATPSSPSRSVLTARSTMACSGIASGVMGPDRRRVVGRGEVGPDERSWRLVPAAAVERRAPRAGHR